MKAESGMTTDGKKFKSEENWPFWYNSKTEISCYIYWDTIEVKEEWERGCVEVKGTALMLLLDYAVRINTTLVNLCIDLILYNALLFSRRIIDREHGLRRDSNDIKHSIHTKNDKKKIAPLCSLSAISFSHIPITLISSHYNA